MEQVEVTLFGLETKTAATMPFLPIAKISWVTFMKSISFLFFGLLRNDSCVFCEQETCLSRVCRNCTWAVSVWQ
jgi:hypothetical protein